MGSLQVIDFGLAAPLEAQMPPGCGTLSTIAPECIVQEGSLPAQDSVAVDVWGLGVTLYITLVGKFPFQVYPAGSQPQLSGEVADVECVHTSFHCFLVTRCGKI